MKTMPRVIRGVDLNRVAIYQVDYYDGNLRGYLHVRRPAYF
jgi:putative IMPACT (imprinted ancient) family translation regulator